ncbi:hypothetical protein DL768_010022 [Monosporascus sp. mg162]|nr:hypothetical protein DL768_010022 [Monosporascus sp. mg162]
MRGFRPCVSAADEADQEALRDVSRIGWQAGRFSDHDPRARGYRWETNAQKPNRRVETVYFDERVKRDLVEGIRNYQDPKTQVLYPMSPYRGGYILHGRSARARRPSRCRPSACSASTSTLKMQSVSGNTLLGELFQELPPYCIVLLEDIDAVGMKRKTEDGEEEEGKQNKLRKLRWLSPDVITPGYTLWGLLNVLDGVVSREGRIILMTSNLLEKLDEALLRPGRIDRKVYLGHIEASGAEQMFRRIFEPDPLEHPDVADDARHFWSGKS